MNFNVSLIQGRLILIISVMYVAQSITAQSPLLKVQNGTIKGYKHEGLHIYKKIPFAAPPIGSLRWKAPQDALNWPGELDCTSFSASPIQREPAPFNCWTEEFIAPPSPLSEDCLYLNVWTKPNGKKKPVVVWIYGGGFNSGSAACAIYDGKYYAQNDIVFVSINYRVNIFGFFAHPQLTAESNGKGAANFGLLDQLHALKWVQKNIAAFEGDPANVTIMGQSAGAFSVHALVASPLAKGYFHKAISHSGGILGTNRGISLTQAETNGVKLTEQIGITSIEALRALSAKELFEKATAFNPPYTPVLDNYYLPIDLKSHYSHGMHNDVKVLTGWVTGDGTLFGNAKMAPEDFKAQLEKSYPDKVEQLLRYFPAADTASATMSNFKMRRLSFGAIPAILWAAYNKASVYIYEFDHVPAPKPNFPDYGAFHTADVPYALHTLDTWKRPWKAEDLMLEKMMSDYWINFIKTGTPNAKNQSVWSPYTFTSKSIMQLKIGGTMQKELYAPELSLLLK